jgi:hypothetical protein
MTGGSGDPILLGAQATPRPVGTGSSIVANSQYGVTGADALIVG